MSATSNDDKLPRELLFEEDGHLSEIALTAVADGEDALLPSDAHAHLAACNECGHKLGDAALLASTITDALREMPARAPALDALAEPVRRASPVPVSPRALAQRLVPLRAIAIGLAFALLGALPMLMRLPLLLGDAGVIAQRGAPIVLHNGIAFLRHGALDRGLLILTFGSAFVLLAAAFFLLRGMRLVTNEEVSR